jgi:excinuclease Cho
MANVEHPEHLRESIAALPAAPGVYIFHGDAADWPLYIGKSVNLRSRVLSHLRNPEEARLVRQTRRISHIRTAGEIGALLLEAQLIKQQQPLLNQRLRRTRQLCSWRLVDEGPRLRPELVESRAVDFACTPQLYGLYASRRAATEALHNLADAQRLCLGALGLERLAPGRACFRSAIGRCAGLCRGTDSPEAHRQRLLEGLRELQVLCWPHAGAVGLVERQDDPAGPACQIHVVRNWCYLGSADDPVQARVLARVAAGFDADGYKILCRPLLEGGLEVLPL